MKPDNPFADLVTTAERLTEVLSHEVALLQAMKPRAIAALREEKDGLINSYEVQARTGQAPVYDPKGRMEPNGGAVSTASQGLSVNREL